MSVRFRHQGSSSVCRTIDKLDIFGDGSCKALYRLDGNANDESGNYHGTETAITYGGGVYERSALFNGSTSYIDTNFVVPATAFSVSFYVKLNANSNGYLIGNVLPNAYSVGWMFYHSSTTGISLGTDNNGAIPWQMIREVGSPLQYGAWKHIVLSIDGSTHTLYIDGVDTSFPVTVGSNTSLTTGSLSSKIGGLGTWWLNGAIDQLRIFNRALTAQEVAILYAECEPTSIVDNINPFEDGSLKALYKFDNDATDATGVYNGTATNVTYASGKFGNCAVFGGSTVNAKATVPYTFPSGGNAISIWAKVDSANQSGGTLFGYAVGTRQSLLRNDYNFLTAGAWMHRLPSGEKVCTNLDEWYHIVYTSNGSEPLKLYVNGVLRTNLIVTNFNWTTFAIDGLGFFATSSTENLTGKLDQLRIFNKALTPLEVASLYNETTPMEEPMSVRVDPFKDGSGKALYRLEGNALDESGNYNGTVTSLTYGLGRFGRGGVFNGSSTRINTSFANFASTGVTLSMWVNITTHKNYNYLATFYENNSINIYCDSIGTISLGGSITSGAYTAGQWLHVVATITSGGLATLYVNGVSIGTFTSTTWFSDTNRNDVIGCGNGALNTYSQYLNGLIDQFRVFNRALTQTEVIALYNEI